jgi:hypothetical protein
VQDFCLREHHFAVKKAIKSTILLTTNSDFFLLQFKEELFKKMRDFIGLYHFEVIIQL